MTWLASSSLDWAMRVNRLSASAGLGARIYSIRQGAWSDSIGKHYLEKASMSKKVRVKEGPALKAERPHLLVRLAPRPTPRRTRYPTSPFPAFRARHTSAL